MDIRWKVHCEVVGTHVPRIFHIPKKLEIANFNSLQTVQDFVML